MLRICSLDIVDNLANILLPLGEGLENSEDECAGADEQAERMDTTNNSTNDDE